MTPGPVDVIEAGAGPVVILIHSSVAGAGQWRRVLQEMASAYRLIAINLYGYGGTPGWSAPPTQTLADQAALVEAVLPEGDAKVSIIGHSFGGAVAMKAAALHAERVDKLVLIEPNPFYLLQQAGRGQAFAEALALRDCIKQNGAARSWAAAARVFADYWTGPGSWDAMPEDRQSKFAEALQPNYHEWDAVLNEATPLEDWRRALPPDTTVIHAADTVRSIAEIVALMQSGCPDWRFETLGEGGHMAALTRPDLMIPELMRALN